MKKNPKSAEWLQKQLKSDKTQIKNHKEQLIDNIKSLGGMYVGNTVQNTKTKEKNTLWERLRKVIMGN